MPTFIDDELYRRQVRQYRSRLKSYRRKADKYPTLRFVPDQLSRMEALPNQFENKLTQALDLRAKELQAEQALDNPTDEMYNLLSRVYGGMTFYGMDEATVQRLFPKGRPDAANTPAGEVETLLKRCNDLLSGELKSHELAVKLGPEVAKLAVDRANLVKNESKAEEATLQARGEVVALSQAMKNEESALWHLARADHLFTPGVFRDLFPAGTRPEAEAEGEGESNAEATSTTGATSTPSTSEATTAAPAN